MLQRNYGYLATSTPQNYSMIEEVAVEVVTVIGAHTSKVGSASVTLTDVAMSAYTAEEESSFP